jgi:hypothetical protein
MKAFAKGLVSIFAALIISLIPLLPAKAAFNPNLVIDDDVFSNSSTMNAVQINNFLNSFSGSCISTNHGFSAPKPIGYSPSGGYVYGGYVSAGEVIQAAASVYNINPQVLLTTLQKEQSLVQGDAGCSVQRYAAAVGYGCPDSGTTHDYSGLSLYAINSAVVDTVNGTCVNSGGKAGFSQQVIRGAWLLKFGQQRSLGNTSWAVITGSWDNSDDPPTCYGGPITQGFRKRCSSDNSTTYYDGYTTIDSTSVHMDSGATAALYWYTPHLHGNSSFQSIFTNWFGASYSPDLYTDSDNDGIVDRKDFCPGTKGLNIYEGCPPNSPYATNSYSGDFNGDGYGDVIVFSVFPDGRTFNVWMYPGSATGLQSPVFQMTLGPNNGGFDYTKSKPVAVNVNGDSYTDLEIFHQGPNDEVVRNTLKGSATGLQASDQSLVVWQTPAQGWNWSSIRVADAGDFNGDGYGDVAMYASQPDGRTVTIWLYKGSSGGLQDPVSQMTLGPTAGGWNFTQMKTVATNVNGDGYSDLVIFHQGPNDEIVRHVLKGSASGLQPSDQSWVQWQFPSQGWLWSNIRIASGNN